MYRCFCELRVVILESEAVSSQTRGLDGNPSLAVLQVEKERKDVETKLSRNVVSSVGGLGVEIVGYILDGMHACNPSA